MLFKQSAKIIFVVYQDQKIVRAFEFNKRRLKFIFLLISSLFLISFFTMVFFLAYFKNNPQDLSRRSFVSPNEQRSKIQELKKELAQVKELNDQYHKKNPKSLLNRNSILPLFSLPQGSKDLTQKKWLKIKTIDIKFHSTKTLFHFNIINNKKDGTKLLGYIFIAMKQGPQVSFYPYSNILFDKTMTSFDKGETFTISRFRKVESYFDNVSSKNSPATFKIFIFSKTGDIIHYQTVGPVKVSQS